MFKPESKVIETLLQKHDIEPQTVSEGAHPILGELLEYAISLGYEEEPAY